jgi:hypothetical protein
MEKWRYSVTHSHTMHQIDVGDDELCLPVKANGEVEVQLYPFSQKHQIDVDDELCLPVKANGEVEVQLHPFSH